MARVSVAILAAVAAALIVGFGFVLLDGRSAPPIVIDDPRPDATIMVEVVGAVATPGVYSLAGDARIQDGLEAAGGLARDADIDAINLAQHLRDEERLSVPHRLSGTAPPGPTSEASTRTAAEPVTGAAAADPDRLDLNLATVADLDGLAGIGPVLAQRIVDYRSAHGGFRSVDELAEVDGISLRMVDDLRSRVMVGG
jgi:competence protein ComEA